MATKKDTGYYAIYGVPTVTIGSYTYRVNSFTPDYGANEIKNTDGDGVTVGKTQIKTDVKATMEIKLASDSSAIPAQFTEFSYTYDDTLGSQTWCIDSLSPKKTEGAQTTVTLNCSLTTFTTT